VAGPVLAAFIGDRPCRGLPRVIMLIGLGVAAVVALLASHSPGLRRLEDDWPGVTPEDRLSQAAPGASVSVGVTESAPGSRST